MEKTRKKKDHYYQEIKSNTKKDQPRRVIKHLILSVERTNAIVKMLLDKQVVLTNRPFPRPKAFNGVLVWNSGVRGTYVKERDGKIGRDSK